MEKLPDADYDVIVIGGAFSGASASLMLKRDLPALRILIVERTAEFDKKVGESTSEVAGCFLTRVLNLSAYLSARHFHKHGLRLWFCHGPDDPVDQCAEMGPMFQSRLPTFQLDRALLDERILEDAVKLGCDLQRPAVIRNIELSENDQPHRIEITLPDGTVVSHTCKWLLDASGKAAVLAKKLDLQTQLGDEHPTSALWCRFSNVNNLDSYESQKQLAARAGDVRSSRGAATNHLMGRGWWCWLIPLSDETFSAGIVWDRRIFDLPAGESLTARLHAHLLTHPIGKLMFANAQPVEDDTFYYKGLAYYSRKMTGHRWIVVGDAVGFIDPLYSQGLDYCGYTVYGAVELLKKSFHGECTIEAAAYLNEAYPRSYRRWFESLYKDKYFYLGDAELMFAAFLMDLAAYFIGPVRQAYRDQHYEFSHFPYDGPIGHGFAMFMSFYNSRLSKLAQRRIRKGTYGRNNGDQRYLIKRSFTADMGSFRLLFRGMRVWLGAELKSLFD